jgi:hypothetical protein
MLKEQDLGFESGARLEQVGKESGNSRAHPNSFAAKCLCFPTKTTVAVEGDTPRQTAIEARRDATR